MGRNRIGLIVTVAAGAVALAGAASAADTPPAKHMRPHHKPAQHRHHQPMPPMKPTPGKAHGHDMPGMNGDPGSGHHHCTVRQAAPPDPAATNGASPYNPGSLQSHAKHTVNIVDAMNHCHVHEIPYAVYMPVAQAVHNPSQAPSAGPQALAQESAVLAQTSGEAHGTLQPLVTAQTEELGRLTGRH